MAEVRTLLVTGAAGAGRTTVAAAVATAAAGDGRRTLLLTADRLTAVAAVPGLTVGRVDPAAAFREGALDAQSRIGALLTLLGAAPLDPEELTELPGADPLALLRALRHARVLPDQDDPAADAEPSPWDLVVVDLPAVRDALRMLALPEQLRRYIWRLLPADRQAARALRPVLAQLAGVPMPAEWAYAAAARADRELAAVQAVIEDPATAVAVVVEPGARGREALRAARTGLALFGHRLAAVVANRLLPTGSADAFLAGLSGQQRAELAGVAEDCAADGVPLVEAAHLGRVPSTPADLAELGAVPLSGGAPRRAEPWGVEDLLDTEGHFLWVLPLPGADREGLDLVRRGDELVVDAGGFRRILPLPSALRRCTVQGAALRDGALRVRFVPDPTVWPS
ncbi:putative ion transporting ATPase [Actinacidiphila reveromycinica]|uniref:Putative ion transporting ATPase n=1 Tax=Actinacidiphila reveromycinica TaxID=659352 RepID=A0A7U3UQI3_9ACTN|nr:ArsA-related P-loop ATPase [Streptomyces sp. SN-593]BBA96811.1 putative ion transporting ATPase [Streptomyces sp. SN-593]